MTDQYEVIPGIRLVFSTRIASEHAIDAAQRVNVIQDEGDLEGLMSALPKKPGCTWCRSCPVYNELGYHTDQCRSDYPERHRSDCEVYCRELPREPLCHPEDHEGSENQGVDDGSPIDQEDGRSIGLGPDAARLLFGLSSSMLDPLAARFATKIKITKKSINLKFYRQRHILDIIKKNHEFELQKLKEDHEYKMMTDEDKLKFKQLRRDLKKEQKSQKRELKEALKKERREQKQEIRRLKSELGISPKKRRGLFRKKSKKIQEEPEEIVIGSPQLVSSSRDFDDVIESAKPVVDESSDDTSSSSYDESMRIPEASGDDEYVNVDRLDCIDDLSMSGSESPMNNGFYQQEYSRINAIPEEHVIKLNVPMNPELTHDEVIEPRKKKTKKSEKFVKKHKIKEYSNPQDVPDKQQDIMRQVFSSYEGTNRESIGEMQREID